MCLPEIDLADIAFPPFLLQIFVKICRHILMLHKLINYLTCFFFIYITD
jgi:hypothetical protein